MASLAELLAGDPMGRVRAGAGKARAHLSDYNIKRKRIEEINKALKAAEEASGKKKGLYGMGGSLLGTLAAIGMNMAFPGMGVIGQRLLQGAMSGIATAGVEKYRQDVYNVTDELDALEEKYRGTKEGDKLKGTITSLKGGLEDAISTGGITSGLMSAAMPTNIGRGFKFDPKAVAGPDNIPGPFTNITPASLSTPSIPDPDLFPTKFMKGLESAEQLNPFGSPGSTSGALLDMIVPGAGAAMETVGDETLASPWMQTLLGVGSVAGAPIMQEMEEEWIADPYYKPEFTNPYT